MEINKQPREKVWYDPLGVLQVHSIWETIQGEGPYVGCPAVFVRLAGCNLECPLCDTDYTSVREKLSPPAVVERIIAVRSRPGLVVITGGEPLRQNIGPLIRMLNRGKHHVQIETNGTYAPPEQPYGTFMIICSPKSPGIHQGLTQFISSYKYIVEAGHVDASDGLPTSVFGQALRPARPHIGFRGTVYVQPVDAQDPEVNQANLDAALQSCMKYDYCLCLQMHKILGLP